MKGSQESLTTVVVKDAANWPTPEATSSCHGHGGTWSTTQFNLHNAAMGIGILPPQWPIRRPDNNTQTTKERMAKRAAKNIKANWPTPDASNHRDGEVLRKDNNLEQGGFHGVSLHHAMTKYGQAAPANPSTDGSRPGLWPTITAHTPDMESNGPNGNSGTYLAGVVNQWGSPRTGIRADTHFSYDRGKHNIEEQAGASMKGGGKLNPRWVETLMGLPVGWVMPSCKSPVTIEPTSFASSEMESCLPQPSELFAF
jgi:hypothetical protein